MTESDTPDSGIDGAWFDVYIKRSFEVRGFSEFNRSDRGWVLTREYPETTWYVIRSAPTLAHWREGRRWILEVGVTLNAGPDLLRLPYKAYDVLEMMTLVDFNVFEFSPGVEFGVPPEYASLQYDAEFKKWGGSDRYGDYVRELMDLKGEMPVAERCRAISEIAERVEKVADSRNALERLREFLVIFPMRPYAEDFEPWLHPDGEFFNLSFEELKQQYG